MRRERDRFGDLNARLEVQVASLKNKVRRAKQRGAVFEQRATVGEARDRSGLMAQVDLLSRKLGREADARVTLDEYSVTRLQSLTNA